MSTTLEQVRTIVREERLRVALEYYDQNAPSRAAPGMSVERGRENYIRLWEAYDRDESEKIAQRIIEGYWQRVFPPDAPMAGASFLDSEEVESAWTLPPAGSDTSRPLRELIACPAEVYTGCTMCDEDLIQKEPRPCPLTLPRFCPYHVVAVQLQQADMCDQYLKKKYNV